MMKERQAEIQSRKKQIHDIIDEFHQIFSHRYQEKELVLVQKLEEEAIRLKCSIQEYKKETSVQKVEELILKKRQEKQSERLKLELMWRELNEKFKKMMAEKKKLEDQNRQAEQDITFLEQKLKQIQKENSKLHTKIQKLKQQKQNFLFEKQSKPAYVSPYKCLNTDEVNLNKRRKPAKNNTFTHQNSSVKTESTKMLQDFIGRADIRDKIFDILYP